MSDFSERMHALAEAVGDGDLVMTCVVDQRYAEVQERHREFHHPRGGKAGYLGDHVLASQGAYCQKLADHAVTEEGSGLHGAAEDVAKDMAAGVKRFAPVEFNDLRKSGHPSVTDSGHVVFDQPPEVPRLSDEQLRRKHLNPDGSRRRRHGS